jgi:hypothetical protein
LFPIPIIKIKLDFSQLVSRIKHPAKTITTVRRRRTTTMIVVGFEVFTAVSTKTAINVTGVYSTVMILQTMGAVESLLQGNNFPYFMHLVRQK